MKLRKAFAYNNVNEDVAYLSYETVNTCPICKTSLAPVFIACSLDTSESASVYNYCPSCHNGFISKYCLHTPLSSPSRLHPDIVYQADHLLYSVPNKFSAYNFNSKIISLSPRFDKIYNQALAAETYGLDEIAGLGYRKALEFLVKDFAIYQHPNDKETIKSKSLSWCIKNYINNEIITTLAERSAWIGNDEAHYVRKQEGCDVSDMKSFIQAIVYFISMILIAEDAASITPK